LLLPVSEPFDDQRLEIHDKKCRRFRIERIAHAVLLLPVPAIAARRSHNGVGKRKPASRAPGIKGSIRRFVRFRDSAFQAG
jgi:hypothetical protein